MAKNTGCLANLERKINEGKTKHQALNEAEGAGSTPTGKRKQKQTKKGSK